MNTSIVLLKRNKTKTRVLVLTLVTFIITVLLVDLEFLKIWSGKKVDGGRFGLIILFE